MADIQKLTGIVGKSQLSGIVSDLVTFIKGQDTAVTNAYKALVGNLGKTTGENPVDHTVKSYVDAAIASVNSDASTLAGRVSANETAIALLNGDSTKTGSVDQKINAAFNDFATKVSNDSVVNTFKEMVDYVAAHKTEYTNLGALVGTLPSGITATTVVGYAAEVAAAEALSAKNAVLGNATTDTAASKTIEGLVKAVAAEKSRAEGAESGLDGRLDTIEGEGDGSIKKALADAKSYADGIVSGKNVSAEGETGAAALVSASAASNKVTVAATQKLKDAVTRAEGAVLSVGKATSTENFVTLTVVDGDNATVAISDAALKTEIDAIETAINGFALMTDADVAEIKALIA